MALIALVELLQRAPYHDNLDSIKREDDPVPNLDLRRYFALSSIDLDSILEFPGVVHKGLSSARYPWSRAGHCHT